MSSLYSYKEKHEAPNTRSERTSQYLKAPTKINISENQPIQINTYEPTR